MLVENQDQYRERVQQIQDHLQNYTLEELLQLLEHVTDTIDEFYVFMNQIHYRLKEKR